MIKEQQAHKEAKAPTMKGGADDDWGSRLSNMRLRKRKSRRFCLFVTTPISTSNGDEW